MHKKLGEVLKNCDAAVIFSPHNLRYFAKFSGGEGALLITREQRFLFTDSRYIEQAQKEAADFEVVLWTSVFDLCKKINETEVKTVAYEENFVTVGYLKKITEKTNAEFVGKECEINRIRMIKELWEIEKIAKAEEIGDKAFSHILSFIKEGVSERDIAAELEYFMKKQGADKTSFDTIAISGKKTSMPHGMPDDKKVENGDFITMDFGCIYDGYCSDMTRTVVLGKADEEQRRIYNIVYKAQSIGLEYIKAGENCSVADKMAREVIEKEGYGKYFGHSLGHGVGLEIHELPTLSPKSGMVLEENMVVSCEPGIYIPNLFGVRIEDLVVVTAGKCRVLSKSQKKLQEI